jgi:hypothetical protein
VAISTFESFGLSGGLGLVIYGDAGRVSSVGRPTCRHRWPPDLNTAPTKKSRPCAGIRDSNLTYLMLAQNLKLLANNSTLKTLLAVLKSVGMRLSVEPESLDQVHD